MGQTDTITYQTALKASGKAYKKIVFWNRFLRNPAELVLTLLPAAFTIVCMALGYWSTFLAIVYAICWFYAFYILLIQFPGSVRYHLKNRAPAESAPCIMTLMDSGIMAEIPSCHFADTYLWNRFTTVYDKAGYYLLFEKKQMVVMLCKADFPNGQTDAVRAYITSHVDRNHCQLLFHG